MPGFDNFTIGDEVIPLDEIPHLSAWWLVYLIMLVVSFVLQLLSTSGMLAWGYESVARKCQGRVMPAISEPVAVIVPCYLPNEAPIILGTATHILEKMEGIEDLRLYIVYNTPKPMPEIEAKLQELCANVKCQSGNRCSATARRIEHSKSKAENLNDVIQKGLSDETYVVIYDADHHPNPDSLALAINHLQDTGVDCVQGSTYIRQGPLLARAFIHAEFFITYFMLLPIMQKLVASGYFGGSNGVWLADSLRTMEFDHTVLTEDIDCFIRSVVRKEKSLKFRFLPQCRSGELTPSGFRAFWKQRLRWTMGWDEATLKHWTSFFAAPISYQRRLGLFYMFVMRWFTLSVTCFIVGINAVFSIKGMLGFGHALVPDIIGDLQFASFALYLTMILFAFLQALLHERSIILVLGLVMFFSLTTFYLFFGLITTIVSLSRLATGRRGGWVVTSRVQQPSTSITKPLLAIDADRPTPSSNLVIYGFAIVSIFLIFGIIGAGVGLAIGTYYGTVTHTYWEEWWNPLDDNTVTKYVVNEYFVAGGAAAGIACGIGCSAVLLYCLRRRKTAEALDGNNVRVAPPEATGCSTAA